ncbi:uncharacterized protein LOC110027735 [Phalaenopsis equestris]|uniref:uncharacterized protein LOC110027735 n=1 Tax=Phalaenopsis equestris TaxID=78828 RepID=UPI0009E26C1C|nr:uncharacterized protein LOC110027735 [Phalaenopsis equestris]
MGPEGINFPHNLSQTHPIACINHGRITLWGLRSFFGGASTGFQILPTFRAQSVAEPSRQFGSPSIPSANPSLVWFAVSLDRPDSKRMVNVYIRRRKKFLFFYKRRSRRFAVQESPPFLSGSEISSLEEKLQNNRAFSTVDDLVDIGFSEELPDPCISEKNQECSEVEFENDAAVTKRELSDNFGFSSGASLHEDETKAKTPIGIGFLNNEPLLSVIQQVPSTKCLQRKPRSARKSTSFDSRRRLFGLINNEPLLSVVEQVLSTVCFQKKLRSARKSTSFTSRRRSLNECSASDSLEQMASHLGALTSVSCEINPKTPIKEDRISKFAAQSKLCSVPDLLSTGVFAGALVKYKKDNFELQGLLNASGICCGCTLCNFEQVVSSLKFEKHARAKSHNQNAHIFLENGKSLYALSKELENVSLGSLGEVMEEEFGYQENKSVYEDCKAQFYISFLNTIVHKEVGAYEHYCAYVHHVGFIVRKDHNSYWAKSKQIKSKDYICGKVYRKRESQVANTVKYKKVDTRTGCQAMVRYAVDVDDNWTIKKFIESHNHPLAESSWRNPVISTVRFSWKISELNADLLRSMTGSEIRAANTFNFLATEVGELKTWSVLDSFVDLRDDEHSLFAPRVDWISFPAKSIPEPETHTEPLTSDSDIVIIFVPGRSIPQPTHSYTMMEVKTDIKEIKKRLNKVYMESPVGSKIDGKKESPAMEEQPPAYMEEAGEEQSIGDNDCIR